MDEKMTELVNALTPESEPEAEQPQTAETPEADTSVQPVTDAVVDEPEDEPKGRSQERIQQLSRKNKELEAEANYWKNLNKQPEVLPIEESDDGVTLDQISTSVVNKLAEKQADDLRKSAENDLRNDAAATLKVYPELNSNDDLATMVVSLAERQKISILSAADKVMGLFSKEKETAEKRVIAAQAQRVGVSSPQGSSVSNGAPAPLDISKMSESEKEENWSKILASLSN